MRPEEWLTRLERERRIVRLTIGGEARYVAAEDVGRYRDALGTPPPPGLPEAFLEPVRDPLGDLVTRYARTHGPFTATEAAARLGIGEAPVLGVLHALAAAGRVVQGDFRPGGAAREWCDTGVLRALRQRSLARLRHEVEPVEPAALGRFLLAWHGITEPRRGADGLLETLAQLQGAAIPASILERQVLPARLPGYDPHLLDALTASGALVWVGREPLGQQDGRVSLFLAENAHLLMPPPEQREQPLDDPLHATIREHLATRGASFFATLLQACGSAFHRDVLHSLWDLVWAGEATNDTLHPLRAFLQPRLRSPGSRSRPRLGSFRSGPPTLNPQLSTRLGVPPEAAGRWSLLETLRAEASSPTERLAAQAQQLLNRHGVLTREAVHAEGIQGGFSAVYPVLRALEESGRIRRGYFVAGQGALQFALPGALERLRAFRDPPEEPETAFFAAADPANPYGAALPWPDREEGRRPARTAGASVVLIDGALAAWLPSSRGYAGGDRQLLTFPEQLPDYDPEALAGAVARTLAAQVESGRRRAIFIQEVDGRPGRQTPLGPALAEAGFVYGPHGYMKRG